MSFPSFLSVPLTIIIFLAIISVVYPLNKRIAEYIGKEKNFLSEESLKSLSRLKYNPLYFSAYKALSSFDLNVLLAILILSQVLGKEFALILLGVSAVFSTFWDTIISSLSLSSDVRGCYRVLRFSRSGAAVAGIYVFISFIWLLAMFLLLSTFINDLDMLVRIFFLIFLVLILDWAAVTFNYGYGIIGAIVAIATVYYVIFPLNFISSFLFLPSYSLVILMIGVPLILFYHFSLLERRSGIEGRWEKYSTLIVVPSVSLLTLLALLWKGGNIASLAYDPCNLFSPILAALSIVILFLPFPRVTFSIHHTLKVQTKIEGSKIARWSTATSYAFFIVASFFCLIFSKEGSLIPLQLSKYMPLVLIAVSLLSIGSVFTFSYEGLEFLAQRVPGGKGSPEVAKMIYLSYYVSIPIILATIAFYHFFKSFDIIYLIVGPTLAVFFLFAFSIRRRKVEE